MFADVFSELFTVPGAVAMGVGAGGAVLVTKKIEHSPRLQAKISNMTAAAGGKVDAIKHKVHPEKTEPDMNDVLKLIRTLPLEQQEAAMAFVNQARAE